MDEVAGVGEAAPLGVCEDVAPRTAAAHERFETAHLLHAVELGVGEADLGVLVCEAVGDGGEVGGAEFEQLGEAVVVAVSGIGTVAQAGVAWGESVGTEVGSFRDDLEDGGILPVQTKEACAEVVGGVDDTVGVAGPEAGFWAGG